ncbi:MAG: hypothetical protein N2321_02250 [Melioribacteraceae bacterium]|nr:hypothetical protein [Melioribacteraceae bacterium]
MNKLKYIFIIIFCSCINYLNAQTSYDLLIKDVNVVDVKNGKILQNQNVGIVGERIKIISKSTEKIKAKEILNGKDKFLIPSLWDIHTHNWWQIHFSDLYVSYGVLGVRNMYTPMAFIKPLKDSIDNNLINGPKYIAAGRVLEGSNPEYPDCIVLDAVEKISPALDTLQMEGSDFVKVYNKIPKEVYFELMKEAKKRGLRVEGHLPMDVSAIDASNEGQRSFEHLLGIPELCTKDTLFKDKHKHKLNWFATVMKEDDYGTMTIDEKTAMENFSVLKRNNTYVCPTLVTWHNFLNPDLPYENNKVLQNLTEEITGFWKNMIDGFRKKDNDYKQMALKKYENLKKVTYLLYKSGVQILTGSDAMNPYCIPGYSLHTELEILK